MPRITEKQGNRTVTSYRAPQGVRTAMGIIALFVAIGFVIAFFASL